MGALFKKIFSIFVCFTPFLSSFSLALLFLHFMLPFRRKLASLPPFSRIGPADGPGFLKNFSKFVFAAIFWNDYQIFLYFGGFKTKFG